MLRNWYFRLMVSYFPIVLLTFFIIVSSSFLVVNEISRTGTEKADGIATEYVIDSLEQAAQDIETALSNEAVKNAAYYSYLNRSEERDVKYGVVRSLASLVKNNELIDSAYLYRASDGAVLTENGQISLDLFSDRPFLEQAWDNRSFRGWSPVRTYKESANEPAVKVITLYKSAPLPFGSEGLLVVNVNLYGLETMIGGMTNHDLSFLRIADSAGQQVYPPNNGEARADSGKVLTTASSESLGWTFKSGIQHSQLFGWVSVVSYVWIGIAVLTLVAALLYVVWISKRNYKPIQLMMSRIQTLQFQSDRSPVKMDDLSRIDRALEDLIHQSVDYEQQQRENLIIERRQLLFDLVNGGLSKQGNERIRKLRLLPDEGEFVVVAVRLNRHEEFCANNTPSEQNMLKFALGNVMQEVLRDNGLEGWGEWLAPDRMVYVLASTPDRPDLKSRARAGVTVAGEWIESHLRLSLSFAIGSVAGRWYGVPSSYRDALAALNRRISIGHGFMTDIDDVPSEQQPEMFKYMQLCADCVQDFRLTNESWRDRLDQIFREMEADAPKDEDVHSLMRLLLQTLGRELKGLSDSLRDCFEGELATKWADRLHSATSLTQMESLSLEYLNEIYRTYVSVSETKSYRAMIAEIRSYIQENFADPDLSLKHLSDRFQITGKYASYLFKQEYDMKFVDFLVALRMQHAEHLLAESDETIQSIAMQVGYANSITFGRVFKRTVGVTPGDYRKLKMIPSNPI
ncbi:helix-turn-helix domain-containing protein [Cohnella thailandensis]|uniref:AraC family transcriptional regulator n=1 Tax=Cohnella thailandensis TaxID=557557 RepID=A0A841T387_9BACL|nr:helix-turn-helix domain-containing protein [Cohnella thailandensis]MBB6638082.1 AraC family transcriptional regulator [Cohnella thailandensis]MBP1971992.1 AraC-like DNA-binding protein [Cohnella thailandensis]